MGVGQRQGGRDPFGTACRSAPFSPLPVQSSLVGDRGLVRYSLYLLSSFDVCWWSVLGQESLLGAGNPPALAMKPGAGVVLSGSQSSLAWAGGGMTLLISSGPPWAETQCSSCGQAAPVIKLGATCILIDG